MQVGRDPIGPVGFDRAQCIYDLADRHVAVDRAHPTPFERRRETIDMDRAQAADAGQLQSFVGKPGEEVTIDLDILLDDAGRPDRSAECRRPAQRTGKGDGERARIERGHIDRERPPMPRLDGELEAEHRIGLRSLRSEKQTSELPSLMRSSYAGWCL